MRVGFFMHDLPPEMGGGYTFENEVLEALLLAHGEARHTFVLLCGAQTAEQVRNRGAARDIEIEVLARPGLPGRLRETALRRIQSARAVLNTASVLDRVARRKKLDFIWFAGIGAHYTNLPYLTVVWDLQHRMTPWFPEFSAGGEWERREMAAWFLRRATAVVTGTEVGRTQIEKLVGVPAERILVLPHPTPAFAQQASRAERAPLPERLGIKRPFLFYPAQFWPHKNHVNLVLAFARALKEHGLELDLVLCGADKGSHRAHVERCIHAAGIRARVHLLGFVSREEIVALYRHARALTYVSWCGPENLPPLEAFALACPVIAARVPGAAEQLGDAALLVDPGDVVAMAAAIAKVDRTPELRRTLIERGRARAARWTSPDYVRGVFGFLDAFEPIARCWTRA